MQDGEDEQDRQGHIGADEGGGEDRGQDSEGRRGGMGQRGEEGGDGAGESRAQGRRGRVSGRGRKPESRSCVASRGSLVPQAMLLVYVVCHGSLFHCRYLMCNSLRAQVASKPSRSSGARPN